MRLVWPSGFAAIQVNSNDMNINIHVNVTVNFRRKTLQCFSLFQYEIRYGVSHRRCRILCLPVCYPKL